MSSDPTRLRDDQAIPEWCREALHDEVSAAPPGFDEAAGLASLRDAIAAAGPAPAARDGVPRWLARSLGGVAVIVTVGAVVTISSSSEESSPTPPPAPVIAHERPVSPETPPAPSEPGIAVESLPPAPIAPTVPPRTKAVATPSVGAKQLGAKDVESAAQPPPAADPLEETRHLAALRRLAEHDPEAAITFAAEGDRRFRRGILGEEREAIAIACLARLGRTEEANRRAVRFLENYPESPFAPSVRRAAKL
ncbi:MAG: hypothetical protein BGO98_34010 [Myxococcales bacterium 68-20]|nr:hypothetical protein [Myxococcales bacterium]OJY25642.1 MAG: hypothetical protein BGO98_34010 [Myxococcales bacterium 68-20]